MPKSIPTDRTKRCATIETATTGAEKRAPNKSTTGACARRLGRGPNQTEPQPKHSSLEEALLSFMASPPFGSGKNVCAETCRGVSISVLAFDRRPHNCRWRRTTSRCKTKSAEMLDCSPFAIFPWVTYHKAAQNKRTTSSSHHTLLFHRAPCLLQPAAPSERLSSPDDSGAQLRQTRPQSSLTVQG